MTNFEDFIKVTNEAKKSIEMMKAKIQTVNDEITTIYNDRYARVKEFWREVGKMFKMYHIIGQIFKTPFIDHDGRTISFKVYISYQGFPEIGVYINECFIQWIRFPEDCKRFMDKNGDSDIALEIKDAFINHWENYEKEFEVIVKEFVTRIMAERIDEAELKYKDAVEDLSFIKN